MLKTIIIAEAGVNHNGNFDLAIELVGVALKSGADYIKFQTFKAENVATGNAEKAVYQKESNGDRETQLSMLKKLELSEDAHLKLKSYCDEKGIGFLSTPFDIPSVFFLKKLGIKIGKIPSGELTNLPLLRAVTGSFPEIILSTGMSDMSEIAEALSVIEKNGVNKKNITILHCNTEYPTPYEDVNLKAMISIGEYFGTKIGYSDHTMGFEVPIAAVAMGATIIEKHFTLDRKMEGPDHAASLEPNELLKMVEGIRHIESALGSTEKKASPSEIKNKTVARRSIVAATKIKTGELFTDENLSVKRPGTGISPMKWDEVIGKRSSRDFNTDELIIL
ncbi:MAG: N-acetylneuraminate synthase [Flavitalea sp.]